MNSALRNDASGQMPHRSGSFTCSIRFMNSSRSRQVEHRLRDDVLRPGLDLPVEPAQFLVEVDRARVHAHADAEPRRLPDRRAREVEAVVRAG